MKVTIGPGRDFGGLTDDYSIAMRLHAQAREATWDPESDVCYINDADAAQAARQARDALEAYAVRVAALPPTPTKERGMLACVGHHCALLARLWDETLTDEGYGTAEDAPVDTAPVPAAEQPAASRIEVSFQQHQQSSGCDGTAICQGCATCPLWTGNGRAAENTVRQDRARQGTKGGPGARAGKGEETMTMALWVWIGSPDDTLDLMRYVSATDADVLQHPAAQREMARLTALHADVERLTRERDGLLGNLAAVRQFIADDRHRWERRGKGGQQADDSHLPRVPLWVLDELEYNLRPDGGRYGAEQWLVLEQARQDAGRAAHAALVRAEKAEAALTALRARLDGATRAWAIYEPGGGFLSALFDSKVSAELEIKTKGYPGPLIVRRVLVVPAEEATDG